MLGPIPKISAGISQVVGLLLSDKSNSRMKYKHISTITKGNVFFKIFLFVKGFVSFFYELFFFRPDIIHIHVSRGFSLIRKNIFFRISLLLKIPTILHLHSFYKINNGFDDSNFKKLTNKILVFMLNHANGIITLSPLHMKVISSITKNPNVFILSNGVDNSEFDFISIGTDKQNVLFMGDLSIMKGAYDLLSAIPSVIKDFPSAQFIFCGHDKKSRFSLEVERLELISQVTIPGFVTNSEKLRWFIDASLFVLPSHEECLPMVILEAMAAGLPIITTRVGGIPDILIENENALFFDVNDIDQLTKQIKCLLKNKRLRVEMGLRNRKKVRSFFDAENISNSLCKIYLDVLGSHFQERTRI
jgi:glycosyltransferase involved in cell wall biosynthesis